MNQKLLLSFCVVFGLSVATFSLNAAFATQESSPPIRCAKHCWRPTVTTKPWQIQLQGKIKTTVAAPVYELDMFSSKRVIRRLHRRHARVLCYANAGSWESFRSDADSFPAEVLGNVYEGFPDERWLDIRRLDILEPILTKRFKECRKRGFDGVDPDNMNGFKNNTGFPLTSDDQLHFNRTVANIAHRQGLAVTLKNDGEQVRQLVKWFDGSVVESCFQFNECGPYRRFIRTKKPVYAIEYKLPLSRFCAKAKRFHFSAIRKKVSLFTFRQSCK